jgi:hypothetical protein
MHSRLTSFCQRLRRTQRSPKGLRGVNSAVQAGVEGVINTGHLGYHAQQWERVEDALVYA